MISGCFADNSRGQDGCRILIFGLLQFLTTPILLIGWIWSILHGCQLYENRYTDKIVEKRDLEQEFGCVYQPKYDEESQIQTV